MPSQGQTQREKAQSKLIHLESQAKNLHEARAPLTPPKSNKLVNELADMRLRSPGPS